jgi:hypothetical protein
MFPELDVEGDDLELAALLGLVRIRVIARVAGTVGVQIVLGQLTARAAESETRHEGTDEPRAVQMASIAAPERGASRAHRALLR